MLGTLGWCVTPCLMAGLPLKATGLYRPLPSPRYLQGPWQFQEQSGALSGLSNPIGVLSGMIITLVALITSSSG